MDNTSTGSPASAHERPWLNTLLAPDERAALLLPQMTLEEKIGMVHGKSNEAYSMAPIARLGIPALAMADGPAGMYPSVFHLTNKQTAIVKVAVCKFSELSRQEQQC